MMDFLQVSALSKKIRDQYVLQDINLHFPAFRRLAIAGETGSGKTTLLKAIAGLVQPDSGTILFEGERVPGPDEKLLPGHPRIAYLSQYFELRNNYRVNDFLEMASQVGEDAARRLYRLCRIEHLLERKTDQLSGGERQRTALARLLTTAPRLLLLDEPFSNLDSQHKQILKTVINDLVEEGQTSCILVSHDANDVLPWASQVIVLREGRTVQQAPPEQVYEQPVDSYTGALFGDFNLLSPAQARAIFDWKGAGSDELLFIRPENIRLEKNPKHHRQGRVRQMLYFGSYAEVLVQFQSTTLLVKTGQTFWKKGDSIGVSVEADSVWPVAH